MENEKKKKVAGKAVALATGISLLLGGLFQSPSDLAQDPRARAVSPPAFELVLPDLPDDTGDSGGGDDDEELLTEEKRRSGFKAAARELILRLPWGIRAFIGVPLWVVGFLLISGMASLWRMVLSPVAGTVIGWICIAAVILAVILCSVKAAFPYIPVKRILKGKTVPAVLAGVALVASADALLPFITENFDQIRNTFRICSTSILTLTVILPRLLKTRHEI